MSGTGATYPDRIAWHRWMGPPESCDQCYGRGVVCDSSRYPDGDDYDERYCDCPCGQLKQRLESEPATPPAPAPSPWKHEPRHLRRKRLRAAEQRGADNGATTGPTCEPAQVGKEPTP